MARQIQDNIEEILKKHPETLWTYFRSKPSMEIKLYEALKAQGVPCYLPMIQKTTEYAYQIKRTWHPMFASYVFASSRQGAFDAALLNKYKLRYEFLSEWEADKLLADLKIVRKYEILGKTHKITVNERIKKGTPVLIKKGYFKGDNGFVVKHKNSMTVTINLQWQDMSLEVDVPTDFIEQE